MQLGLRYEFEELNLIIGGGLDDVWYNTQTDEIHIVDYKSTASGMNSGKDGLKENNTGRKLQGRIQTTDGCLYLDFEKERIQGQ